MNEYSPDEIFKGMEWRIGNKYTGSLLGKFLEVLDKKKYKNHIRKNIKSFSDIAEIEDFMNEFLIKLTYDFCVKDFGINITQVYRQGYIEYRYIGGKVNKELFMEKLIYFCYITYLMTSDLKEEQYHMKLKEFLSEVESKVNESFDNSSKFKRGDRVKVIKMTGIPPGDQLYKALGRTGTITSGGKDGWSLKFDNEEGLSRAVLSANMLNQFLDEELELEIEILDDDSQFEDDFENEGIKIPKNIFYEPPIISRLEKTFQRGEEREWYHVYFAFDIHGVISKPDHRRGEPKIEYYPYAKETLQLISQRDDIVIFIFSSSYPEEMDVYMDTFRSDGINFRYVNENPEIGEESGAFGYYYKKPYYNILFEDKAGFNPDKDWKYVYNYFRKTKYRPDPEWKLNEEYNYKTDEFEVGDIVDVKSDNRNWRNRKAIVRYIENGRIHVERLDDNMKPDGMDGDAGPELFALSKPIFKVGDIVYIKKGLWEGDKAEILSINKSMMNLRNLRTNTEGFTEQWDILELAEDDSQFEEGFELDEKFKYIKKYIDI